MRYIRPFASLSMADIGLVGGKNASLGQMIQGLAHNKIPIPDGFAITVDGYWHFIDYNGYLPEIKIALKDLDTNSSTAVQKAGAAIRRLIAHGRFPSDLEKEIVAAYRHLSAHYKMKAVDVAVRSSATAEDLPTASFAGQQESYLSIKGEKELLVAIRNCMASLFTDRAIIYRQKNGFDHFAVGISVGIQKMVRADKGSAGVAFSLDTESGFKDLIMIEAAWGLGESVVKGMVTPDSYGIFKPKLQRGLIPIIKKECGSKEIKIVYRHTGIKTKEVKTTQKERRAFCLTDDEILHLAQMVKQIEHYFSIHNKEWTPVDVEWAKDGNSGTIFIVQARPETVYSVQKKPSYIFYYLKKPQLVGTPIVIGQSVGSKIVSGVARIISSIKEIKSVQPGDIIITRMTNPDWVAAMKKAAGIVTDLGGRTCHAAIVSRELGIPALVGTRTATKKIHDGQLITIDCSQGQQGYIYKGEHPFTKTEIQLSHLPDLPIDLLVNCADPQQAFKSSQLPVAGVGLARIEFIIATKIKIHPMVLVSPCALKKKSEQRQIASLIEPYQSERDYFISVLSQGIGSIAAAFYPRPVVVRFSDFKTNEYASLLGGSLFEHSEANPMLGFRGAARYLHADYKEAFAFECQAIKRVRETMGLENLKVMVPFVRTLEEAQEIIELLEENGLKRGKKGLQILMMCEIPSNVLLIDQFARYFDGFSIGSNDLTQLTLGVDRDSAIIASLFDERDPAVKQLIVQAIKGAHAAKRPIGICGQAPSDYPDFAKFLIKNGIDSISLNADAIIPFLMNYKKK